MFVKFWGVRGTVPVPGQDTVVYGGNTSCVEMRCGENLLIFDAGSGLRDLGRCLLAQERPVRAHLLFSHTHLDHILGLPFFKPGYYEGNTVDLWSGHLRRQGRSLEEVLGRLMKQPYFPVKMKDMQACHAFRDFDAGDSIEIAPGVHVRTAQLNHPGGATAYRVDHDGRSFSYVTDTEHEEGRLDEKVMALIEGCDMVVYDATYTDAEYPRFREWGHSTWQQGVRLCEEAGARRLVAFHHDPNHDDLRLAEIDRALQEARPGSFVAREGQSVELT